MINEQQKTIRINGVDTPISEANQRRFKEFLDGLNTSLKQESQVVASVLIDGKEISEAEETHIQNTPLTDLGLIEIMTSSPADLAYETLSTLQHYVERLVLSIERAAHAYKQKNLVTGDSYFAKSIDGIDLFVQTISSIKLALKVGLNPKVALAEASLISVMNDLLEAKRQNNYIFLAELLERDLTENMLMWSGEIFPLLRNWKNN